jgi:hypothetical protein
MLALRFLLVLSWFLAHGTSFVLEAPRPNAVIERYSFRFVATQVPGGARLCVWAPQTASQVCSEPSLFGRATLLVAAPVEASSLGRYDFTVTVDPSGLDGDSKQQFISVALVAPHVPPVLYSIAAEAAAARSYDPFLREAFAARAGLAQRRCACRPDDGDAGSSGYDSGRSSYDSGRSSGSNTGGSVSGGAPLPRAAAAAAHAGDIPCERTAPGDLSFDRRAWRTNGHQAEWLRAVLFPDVYGGLFIEAGAADVFSSLTDELERYYLCWTGCSSRPPFFLKRACLWLSSNILH